MKINIQRPKKEQFPETEALFSITILHTFQEAGLVNLLDEAHQGIQALSNTLKRDFKSNGEEEYFLIASLDQKIVGTIAFGKPNQIIRENIKSLDLQAPEIKAVFVLPSFQHQGIASLLSQRIIEVISDREIQYFYLDSGHKKAQKFWTRKLGAPYITLKNYWSEYNHHMIWYQPTLI